MYLPTHLEASPQAHTYLPTPGGSSSLGSHMGSHSHSPRWKPVGAGKLVTTFFPDDDSAPTIIEGRHLKDKNNVAVVYHNPLDNVPVRKHMSYYPAPPPSILVPPTG